jgi:hypothetical protein
MPRFALPSLFLPAVLCALALSACGGSRQDNPGNDGGSTTSLGQSCSFDSDCVPPGPPAMICSSGGICVPGCAQSGCAAGLTCKASSGHCVAGSTDGGVVDGGNGNDGGVDAGPDAGLNDGGMASATLCGACSTNTDCQNSGLCISDPTHTYTYCTQDCTSASCPSGFLCTTDSTNSHHQCIPSGGSCPNHGAGDGGTGDDGGTGTGTGPTDPNNPSTNGNGTDQCSVCNENNDCVAGAICLGSTDTGANDGYCAAACDPTKSFSLGVTFYLDCVSAECLSDVVSFNFSAAAKDCAINYSVCGPVDGTSATFCSSPLSCGAGFGF